MNSWPKEICFKIRSFFKKKLQVRMSTIKVNVRVHKGFFFFTTKIEIFVFGRIANIRTKPTKKIVNYLLNKKHNKYIVIKLKTH